MKLAVLNPGGNDRERAFPDFAGAVDDAVHAPVNYHAYAACTAGSFHRKISAIPSDQKQVLLLIRWDLPLCLKTLRQLKAANKTVAVSLKESGAVQFAERFLRPSDIEQLHEICALADGCISSTPFLEKVYRAAGAKRVAFIPTPYPISDSRWAFSVPLVQRRGVFIGTREFEIPSRNHLAALMLAREFGEKITVVNVEDRPGRKRLAALKCDALNVVEGPLPYSEYLRLMASHRVVFQLDRSGVPGQVAGDALLARMPCVGGDGAIDRLAFGEPKGDEIETVQRLLSDDAFWEQSVATSVAAGKRLLSFESGRVALEEFFSEINRVV